jgi:hypothetical protein
MRRPFANSLNLGDVIRLPNYETGNYDHDNSKTRKANENINKNLFPWKWFSCNSICWSGTECEMSAKENRNFVGFEITKNSWYEQ